MERANLQLRIIVAHDWRNRHLEAALGAQ